MCINSILFLITAVPLVFGPIFFPIGHTILSSISCIKDTKDTGCCDQSNAWSDCGLITGKYVRRTIIVKSLNVGPISLLKVSF